MKSPLRISVGIAVVALLLPSIASSAVGTALVSNALQATVIAVTSQLQTLAVRWLSIYVGSISDYQSWAAEKWS